MTCKEAWKALYDYIRDLYDEDHNLAEAMFVLAEAAKYQDNYNEQKERIGCAVYNYIAENVSFGLREEAENK